MSEYDAIVLGAGPAGSTAAFFLAEAGLRVALVEKGEFPRKRVCGEFVSATTFPVLDAMRVGDALRAVGGPPTRRVGFYAGDATPTAPMPALPDGGEWGRTLARAVLDPTLLRAAEARGAKVYQPYKAVGLVRESDSHRVTLRAEDHEEVLCAPVVVAAHGSWEVGALPTQPSRTDAPGDVLAFKAFFHDATFDDDLMILAGFPGGYGGMVHRDRDTVGLSFCVRRDVLAQARAEAPGEPAWDALLRHVRRTNRGVAEAVEGARLESAPRAAGPLRPGFREAYREGLFRVGNAAGEAHPTVAEGISMAIQSGFLLARHLAPVADALTDRPRLDAAGAAYARAWRTQFGGRVRTADALARLCMAPALYRTAIPILESLPALLTAAAVLTGKTKPLGAASAATPGLLSQR